MWEVVVCPYFQERNNIVNKYKVGSKISVAIKYIYKVKEKWKQNAISFHQYKEFLRNFIDACKANKLGDMYLLATKWFMIVINGYSNLFYTSYNLSLLWPHLSGNNLFCRFGFAKQNSPRIIYKRRHKGSKLPTFFLKPF